MAVDDGGHVENVNSSPASGEQSVEPSKERPGSMETQSLSAVGLIVRDEPAIVYKSV
jgi:hypothetical protein